MSTFTISRTIALLARTEIDPTFVFRGTSGTGYGIERDSSNGRIRYPLPERTVRGLKARGYKALYMPAIELRNPLTDAELAKLGLVRPVQTT